MAFWNINIFFAKLNQLGRTERVIVVFIPFCCFLVAFLPKNGQIAIARVDRRPQALFPAKHGLKNAKMRKDEINVGS